MRLPIERDVCPDLRVFPPPPHDPREREVLLRVQAWEVRAFPRGGRMHAYFAPRGLLHLQLWHPRAGVSVLTPSRLTCGRYEIYPFEGWKLPVADMQTLYRVMSTALRLDLPSPARLAALERWFVAREARCSMSAEPPAPSPDLGADAREEREV